MRDPQENRARDEQLDKQIDGLLSGKLDQTSPTPGEQVAREFARLTVQESPRMSNVARTQGLNAIRARAAQKHAGRRPNLFALLFGLPRLVQIGAVALVVISIANGVSNAAADALPGSILYPFKRFSEGGQLLLQNTNGQRAQLWMNLANTRLDEV